MKHTVFICIKCITALAAAAGLLSATGCDAADILRIATPLLL